MNYWCLDHVPATSMNLERGTWRDLPDGRGHTPDGITCMVHNKACPKPWASPSEKSFLPGIPYNDLLEEAEKKRQEALKRETLW